MLAAAAPRGRRAGGRLGGLFGRKLVSFMAARRWARPTTRVGHRAGRCPWATRLAGAVGAGCVPFQRSLHNWRAQHTRSLSTSQEVPDGSEHYYDTGDDENAECYRSVVKIFTTMSAPNYLMPWQNKPHRDSTGSGFAISGRRIITNAHCVSDSAHCQVRKHGEASKFTAHVVATSHEADLAVLVIDEDEANAFWGDLKPLELGEIPELMDEVTVVGYPTGGDNISVTGGVVSRVDFQQYAHGYASAQRCHSLGTV